MNYKVKRTLVILINVCWIGSFLYALAKTYMIFEDIHLFMIGPIYMLAIAPAIAIIFEVLCYFICPLESIEERKKYIKLCLCTTGAIYVIYAYIYIDSYIRINT